MAITSKLQVVTKDSNNKVLNRTVSYVNPETSDSDLTRFATAYTGLSRRTFSDVYRINREDITNATAEPAINVTPAVTIADNAITFATPWFTPAKEQELIQKLMCNMINASMYDIVYTAITGVESDDGKHFKIYGTLNDGTVVNADNYETTGYDYTAPTRYANYLSFYVSYATIDRGGSVKNNYAQISLSESDLITRLAAGTLNIANGIADLNAQLATEFASNTLGGVPQFTYNPSAGSVALSGSFADTKTYAFYLTTDDTTSQESKGNILLRELIGNDLFTEYYNESAKGYDYIFLNPNYAE